MSFGKNPYVAKAEAAEQKAADATDDTTRLRALREAAHEWDRAAAREKPGKRRDEYTRHAERARALADGAEHEKAEHDDAEHESAPRSDATKTSPDRWN